MTLEDYIHMRLVEVKAMREHWLECHQEDSDNYPLEMSEEDWHEQEIAFIEMEYGRDVE